MNPADFIAMVAPSAVEFMREHGIPASVLIAQGALESGWGAHAPGNNLFGIKWTSGCGFDYVEAPTREFMNGKWVTITARFRKYDSIADSIKDRGNFLLQNSRYANLRGTDYKTACQLLQKDGYATDPTYAKQLLAIIEQYQLYKYDQQTGGDDVKIKDLPTLQQGVTDHKNAVIAVQAIVGVDTDGVFGPVTRDAVKDWQKKHGLADDGIVGPLTWAKMFS
jgi:flagellum-specific peptidoglycan hydrolase FlgJ